MLVDIVLGDGHIQMSKSRPSSEEANNYSIHQKLTECSPNIISHLNVKLGRQTSKTL